MASTTPRTKAAAGAAPGTASRRGPRRPPVIAREAGGAGPDLDALRADLDAAILAEHPGADLEPVGRAFDLAVSAHETQKRASGDPFVTTRSRRPRSWPSWGSTRRRSRRRCSMTSRRTPSTA